MDIEKIKIGRNWLFNMYCFEQYKIDRGNEEYLACIFQTLRAFPIHEMLMWYVFLEMDLLE